MGVLLHRLGGYSSKEGVAKLQDSIGKTIRDVVLEDDRLTVTFADDTTLAFFDNGQSCCESRYMRTDDTLADFANATFLGAELESGPDEEGEYGDMHEIQFLRLQTSAGPLVCSSHNEHNGYYGGFAITVS